MTAHVMEKLSPYLDGELTASEAAAVQAHLRDCSDCARRLSELAAVDDLARAIAEEAPGGYFESFPLRLRQKLPQRAPRPRRLPMWALAAAAVLLIAVVTPLTFRQRSLGPSVTEMPRANGPQAAPSLAPKQEGQDRFRGLGYAGAPEADAGRGRRETGTPGGSGQAPGKAIPESIEREVPAKREEPTAPPPASGPQVMGAAAAPAQAPGTGGGRPMSAAASPRGPWFQSQPQSQSPGAFVPPPSGRAEARKDERAQEAEDTATPETKIQPAVELGADRRADRVGAVGVGEDASVAPGGKGKAAVGFEALRARRAHSAAEARDLREAWRQFVAANPSDPRVDEARVAGIEAGALAFRLSHDRDDRARTETDARAYLAREDAAQADRVRALLASLGR